MASVLAGCGGEAFEAPPGEDPEPTADVAGQYLVAVTNGDNACELENWKAGEQSSGIELVVTQHGESVTAIVGGWVGTYFQLITGTNALAGSIDGSDFSLQTLGTVVVAHGTCELTVNVEASGTATGDAIQGAFRFIPVPTGATDCGILEDCVNEQLFSGSRPPDMPAD